ncbi:MAG: adhesin, partial [Comamonadaceae bacterium]
MAGQRAEVVIANPSGISIDGAGFINASGVTLTTGTPALSGGHLESYRVQGGSVRVDGAGLDTASADYTAILARAVQVNAGIWAKDLRVVTGANLITADEGAVTQVAQAGPAPSFSLDVAALGGMYAGKITLVGTEAGLGVRNAGVVSATGNLAIDADGWLSNSGTLQAAGSARITAGGAVGNSGHLTAQTVTVTAHGIDNGASGAISGQATSLHASGLLVNRGLIDGSRTRLDAAQIRNIGTGRVYGDDLGISADILLNDVETVAGQTTAATIAARERLDIGVGELTNREHA